MELAGRTLGNRYRIDALIGRGGMADVYSGVDTILERTVAIKILTDRSDDVRKRFLREAQSMARLNHRNIVSVYDAGQTNGLSYIIMEFVDGRTLAAIPPAELTTHMAIRYFIDLLDALQFAHDLQIVHRDIKPANIMVLADGTVKVMDFGLSRRTSEMSQISVAGEIVGTIAYLSPERFLGKAADARSDLYSVGVMMYEVFAGTVPFKSDTDDLVSVIFAHVNEPPASMRSINRSVPIPIERIVMRLLEKQPDRRYQAATEVMADLQHLVSGGGAPQATLDASPINGVAPSSPAEPPVDASVREALDKTFGPTLTLNEAYSQVLAGMLATRKRDYPEAMRTYQRAMRAFEEVSNDLEYAKTALKFATMILQKNTEIDKPDKREIDQAGEALGSAIPVLRGRRMLKELEEGERLLYALQRIGVRYR